MSGNPPREWWSSEQEEDLTLTRPLAAALVDSASTTEAADPGFEIHPAFAVEAASARYPDELDPYSMEPASHQYREDTDEVLTTLAPLDDPMQARNWAVEASQPIPSSSDPYQAFMTAVPAQRTLPELSQPSMRARFDSEVSTWRKTIPALRRILGLSAYTQAPTLQAYAMGSVPPPSILEARPRSGSVSPLLLVAMAVSLVAIVVMSIVGFGSNAREALRFAHARNVSATGVGGEVITDAKVFVDGSKKCDALPCDVELSDGVHWITVRSPGYETPASRSLTVGTEEPVDVTFELAPSSGARAATTTTAAPIEPVPLADALGANVTQAPASAIAPSAPHPAFSPRSTAAVGLTARLNINAIPASGVVLDGRPIGRTPIMGYRVKPGAHTVVFVGPNGQRASRSTMAEAGATATVAARL